MKEQTILTTKKISARKNVSLLRPAPPKPMAYVSTMTPERRLRERRQFILIQNTKLLNKLCRIQAMSTNPSSPYKPSKSVINCYIPMSDLNSKDLFNDKIKQILNKDDRYIVYTKVRYNREMFFMVGNQFGFHYDSNNSISELFDDINIRLDEYLSSYNLSDEEIMYVQISFRVLNKHVFNSLKFIENNKIGKNENKRLGSIISFPVFKDVEDLKQKGVCLPVYFDMNNNITNIEITLNGIKTNFWDKILEKSKLIRKNKVDSVTRLDSSYTFVYIKSNIDYVLAVKQISGNSIETLKFSVSGVLISKSCDTFTDNNIIRVKGKEKLFINNNNQVTKSVSNISFDKLSKYNLKYFFWHENPNIGVIDTETYRAQDDVHKIYALGFRTHLADECFIYYINQEVDSSKIVLEMINELLRPKYNKIKFYCHNLGGYDIVFILKTLNDYNENNEDKYGLNCILRDDVIIKLTIRKDGNKLEIADSYCILTSNLDKLGKDFNTDVKKSYFPYEFAREKNLFYKGETPSITFYKDISTENYNKLYTKNWDFKAATISYLKDDLNCLYLVLSKANRQIHNDYNINIMEANTISGLAMKLYLNKHYNDNIPNINKHSIYTDIKQGYYGGITEVYIPYGENLYYYDVNSLYPYAALNDMPGLQCRKINFYSSVSSLEDLFGFFYCKIESPTDSYIGLLPIRNKSGIMMPLGTWEGWYFSEELKFAQENGYKVSVYKGYDFNRVQDTFKKYIDVIYKIKSNPINNTQKVMAKSLLNNLLGKFGTNIDKPQTTIMTKDEFEKRSLISKIQSYREIGDNRFLVTYSSKLDHDIIKSHGLDIFKVLAKNNDKEISLIDNSSVVISSAVTAYARIHISKIKLYILNKGGNIYYSDTDSIVTDIKLPDNMVNANKLGLLKLEHMINKGIFITGKTYCFMDDKGHYFNKSKGIKSNSLIYTDYEQLLKNIPVVTGIKSMSHKDWNAGDVKIFDKENITINSDSYTKRSKITKDGLWVNTKPNIINLNNKKMYHTYNKNIYINYFDKSLIIYKPITSLIIYKPITSLIIYKPYTSLIIDKYNSDCINNKWSYYNIVEKYRLFYLDTYLNPLLLLFFILLYLISFILIEEDIVIIEEDPSKESEEDSSKSSYFNSWISLFKSPHNKEIDSTISELYAFNNEKSFTEKNLSLKSNYNIFHDAFINNVSKEDIVNKQDITLNTDNLSNNTIFSPFTPDTLEALKGEIDRTNKAVKDITSDNKELSLSTTRKLSDLMADQEYFLNQHKNHLEAMMDKSNKSLDVIENKLSAINEHETKLSEMKNNLMDYKDRLLQDKKPMSNYNGNEFSKNRKISSGLWKDHLSPEEIELINGLEDKVLKDTIKNRIELEKKP